MRPWGILAPLGFASPHFTYRELACHHCGRIVSVERAEELARFLEDIRIHFSALAKESVIIHIDSAHRCPTHNRAIGGKSHSQHKRGLAADIKIDRFSPSRVYEECMVMHNRGQIGGVGRYEHFTHVDKGPKRTWEG